MTKIATGVVAIAAAIPTGGTSLTVLGALGGGFGIAAGSYSVVKGTTDLIISFTNNPEISQKLPDGILNATVGLTITSIIEGKEVDENIKATLNLVEGVATFNFGSATNLQKVDNAINIKNLSFEGVELIKKNTKSEKYMRLEDNKVNYKYIPRAVFHLFDWGFFYLLMLVFFSFFINIWVFFVFFVFFFYYVLNRFHEAIFYIYSIIDKGDYILIEYFNFNNGLFEKVILKEKLKLNWYDSVKGNIKAPRLMFEVDNKVEFIQYSIGKWDKEKLIEIFNKLNKD